MCSRRRRGPREVVRASRLARAAEINGLRRKQRQQVERIADAGFAPLPAGALAAFCGYDVGRKICTCCRGGVAERAGGLDADRLSRIEEDLDQSVNAQLMLDAGVNP